MNLFVDSNVNKICKTIRVKLQRKKWKKKLYQN